MSLSALLSAAWWGQKLSGIGAQAVAIAVGATVLCAAIAGGLAWIYHLGVAAERADGQLRAARAEIAARAEAAKRYANSQKIAEQRATLGEAQRAADAKRIADLEQLASTNPPASDTPVKSIAPTARQCWSPAQIQRMNRL